MRRVPTAPSGLRTQTGGAKVSALQQATADHHSPRVRVPVRLAAPLAALLGSAAAADDDNDNVLFEDELLPRLVDAGLLSVVEAPGAAPSSEEKKASARAAWAGAFTKALKVAHDEDPWAAHQIGKTCRTELVLRHDYDAETGQWRSSEVMVKMEGAPFANGAMRECFRLKKMSTHNASYFFQQNWAHCGNYVAKRYFDPAAAGRAVLFDDVQMQMESKLWGARFDALGPPKQIDFLQAFVLEFTSRAGSPLFACEKFVEGEYVKHNTNSGWVEAEHHRATPQVFSHFTFEASRGRLMIVDMQGVDDLYTDPQFHTWDGVGYGGEGNLAVKGMAMFFATYATPALATSLGLTPFPLSPKERARILASLGSSAARRSSCGGDGGGGGGGGGGGEEEAKATDSFGSTITKSVLAAEAKLAEVRAAGGAAAAAAASDGAVYTIGAADVPSVLLALLASDPGLPASVPAAQRSSVTMGVVHWELARYCFLGVLPGKITSTHDLSSYFLVFKLSFSLTPPLLC